MRLSDHADVEYRVHSDPPQCPVAKVCQAQTFCSVLDSAPRDHRSAGDLRGSRQRLAALPATLIARAQSKRKTCASALSASSANRTGHLQAGPRVGGTSSQAAVAGPEDRGSEPDSDPLSLTLLTVLAVFSGHERMRITLLPARPSRLNAISIPSARRNVYTRRKWPARARGFFAQPVPFGIRSLLRSTLTRRRSAALPVQEGRSLMNSRRDRGHHRPPIRSPLARCRKKINELVNDV